MARQTTRTTTRQNNDNNNVAARKQEEQQNEGSSASDPSVGPIISWFEKLDLSDISLDAQTDFANGCDDAMYASYVSELESVVDKNESELTAENFEDLIRLLQNALRNKAAKPSTDNKESFFAVLANNGVSFRSFVVLVTYLQHRKPPSTSTNTEIENFSLLRFVCSRVYVCLLCMESSTSYNIFNPFAFRTLFSNIRQFLHNPSHNSADEDEDEKSHDNLEDDGDDAMRDDEDSDEEATNKRKKATKSKSYDSKKRKRGASDDNNTENNDPSRVVVKQVIQLLSETRQLFKLFSMENTHREALNYAIETLCLLTRTSYSLSAPSATTRRRRGKANAGGDESGTNAACFELLSAIVESYSKSGNGEDVDGTVYSHVLQNLLPNFFVVKHSKEIIDATVQFICDTLSKVAGGAGHVLVLMQHLCTKATEQKADVKSQCSSSIERLWSQLPEEEMQRYAKFLHRFSRNAKPANRLFAIECASKVLKHELERSNVDEDNEMKDAEQEEKNSLLLGMIISRASDKNTNVRTKALSLFANVLDMTTNNEAIKNSVSRMLEEIKHTNTIMHTSKEDIDDDEVEGSRSHQSSASLIELDSLIRRRVDDEKPLVRKAAIQVLEMLIYLNCNKFASVENINIFKKLSLDSSLVNRKQAVTSLANLAKANPLNEIIYSGCLSVILVLMFDAESSVSEKCIDYFVELVLDKIVKADKVAAKRAKSKKSSEDDLSDADQEIDLLWRYLHSLDSEQLRRFQRACILLAVKKKLSATLIPYIQRVVYADNNNKCGWAIFEELAKQFPHKIDSKLVMECYDNMKNNQEFADTFPSCLNVVSSICVHIHKAKAQALSDELFESLKTFSTLPNLIAPYVSTLAQLNSILSTSKEFIKNLYKELLSLCEKGLSTFVLTDGNNSLNESIRGPEADQKLTRYLFTVGEVAMKCTFPMPKHLVTLLQALVASSLSQISLQQLNASSDLDASTSTAIKPSQSVELSPQVRAHAFVALGKLCLVDESLAKKCIALFVTELQSAKDEVVRNNILVIMSDLCVRYTALVDRHVMKLTECIADKSSLVRRNCIALLTQLLAEDYIKWRAVLLFRFMIALADDNPHVSKAAEFTLCHLLPRRQPNLIYNHFIEAIFVLNNCRDHPSYNKIAQTKREISLFSLEGSTAGGKEDGQNAINERKRHFIYGVLLSQLNMEQRLKTHGRLHTEVLTQFTEGTIKLNDDNAKSVLYDIIHILSSKEMKLNQGRAPAATNADTTANPAAANPANAAASAASMDDEDSLTDLKGKIMNQVIKKHISENVVPVIIELKRALEKYRSPLLKNVMLYLQDVMRDYKKEVQDILSGDRQLAKELEFDMRRLKEQKKMNTVVAKTVAVAKSPFKSPFKSPRSNQQQHPQPLSMEDDDPAANDKAATKRATVTRTQSASLSPPAAKTKSFTPPVASALVLATPKSDGKTRRISEGMTVLQSPTGTPNMTPKTPKSILKTSSQGKSLSTESNKSAFSVPRLKLSSTKRRKTTHFGELQKDLFEVNNENTNTSNNNNNENDDNELFAVPRPKTPKRVSISSITLRSLISADEASDLI